MAQPDSKSPYRLMVEGSDDKWTIINLLKRHQYDWEDQSKNRPYVDDVGGVEEVIRGLSAALKTFDRLGIVLDADLQLDTRWQRICARASELGIALPEQIEADGLVMSLHASKPLRFGVWLMPDNSSPGALEGFLATLVPVDDPCWAHAGAATTQARAIGAPLREVDQTKGTLHSWLAWQADPGQPFGTAINARVFDHDSSVALRFVAWFQQLYVSE